GRVALLGITGSSLQVKYPANRGFQKQSKVLAFNVKTAGDWLRAKRLAKNLTPGHLALKMGIAASLVCSWESCSSVPDTHQVKLLANILGFDAKDFETQPTTLRR
ncbi:MAG: helix-turn-helix transcriptional regulator, partial [Verrucomicrobiota bacterium]